MGLKKFVKRAGRSVYQLAKAPERFTRSAIKQPSKFAKNIGDIATAPARIVSGVGRRAVRGDFKGAVVKGVGIYSDTARKAVKTGAPGSPMADKLKRAEQDLASADPERQLRGAKNLARFDRVALNTASVALTAVTAGSGTVVFQTLLSVGQVVANERKIRQQENKAEALDAAEEAELKELENELLMLQMGLLPRSDSGVGEAT